MYVLGAATLEEQQEVEQMSTLYPEIKAELLALQIAMDEYAYEFEVEPAPHVKQMIESKLFEANSIFRDEKAVKKELNLPQTRDLGVFWKGFALVASVLLIISVVMTGFFYQLWQTSENQLAIVKKENSQIASEVKVIENTNNVIVTIKGVKELAPDLEAWVYWDKTTHETHIFCPTLPVPPEGKQYQLWAIDGESVVDAGVFDLKGLQKVKNVDKFQKFAVSLEKKGGVPKAEGAIYALGGV
jgi:anti-sigma-K factor RskA